MSVTVRRVVIMTIWYYFQSTADGASGLIGVIAPPLTPAASRCACATALPLHHCTAGQPASDKTTSADGASLTDAPVNTQTDVICVLC